LCHPVLCYNESMLKISPKSLDLYFECPKCFWQLKRENIKRPGQFPYELNIEVDEVLKQEFDHYRKTKKKHPLLQANNIPGELFNNQTLLNKWRSKGLAHIEDKVQIYGLIDDIIDFGKGKLAPFDYKSTGKDLTKITDRFQLQMDLYTYLLEQNGYSTPRKGIMAFYLVDKNNVFEDKLPFRKEIKVIDTDPTYIKKLFKEVVSFLKQEQPLNHSEECEYGAWLKTQ